MSSDIRSRLVQLQKCRNFVNWSSIARDFTLCLLGFGAVGGRVPMGCTLNIGTVPMGYTLNIGTVPMGCTLNIETCSDV